MAALLAALSTGPCFQGPGEAGQTPAPAPSSSSSSPGTAEAPTVLAVRTADDQLAAAVRRGDFFLWALPRLGSVRVEVGPEVREPLLVVDRLPASAATREMLGGLPVELAAGSITLAGTRYPAAGRALALRLPGEGTTGWVVAGGDEEAAAELANEMLFRLAGRRRSRLGGLDMDYLLRETAWLQRSGRWRPAATLGPLGETARWEIDPAAERDDIAARDRAFAALVAVPGQGVELLAAPAVASRPEVRALAAGLDRAAAEMARRVPVTLDRPVTAVIEPDHLTQARHTGEVGEAVPGGGRADLALVLHPDDGHAYRHGVARILLGRAGLAGRSPVWLERGAALWLSGDWYGRPWRDWLPTLAAARALPTPEQLLAVQEQGDASALLWTPAAAAVVDRLPGASLREKLARVPAAAELGRILAGIAESARAAPPQPPRPKAPLPPFLAGVSLAMLNSLEGGYHAPAAGARLEALAALGADAVSLMPFAYQPAPGSPDLTYLNRGPQSETDVGLLHAARLARAKGFRVLYKPHIWVSHESWPGEIAMQSEEDWARWWDAYRRYVLHHALLASWSGSELFSVGVELSRTLGREAEWRDLIAAVRLFYGGAVTYSGNWDGDLDKAPFWDLLDLVGVDAYFPLAASPEAGPEELARGAREVVARLEAAARRTGKPLLLTEVGFAARKAAWTAPHAEGGEPSGRDQAAAYEALLSALGRPPWLAGTFVWKAFSGEERWARDEADFRFLGRPAEQVVRRYYTGAREVRSGS